MVVLGGHQKFPGAAGPALAVGRFLGADQRPEPRVLRPRTGHGKASHGCQRGGCVCLQAASGPGTRVVGVESVFGATDRRRRMAGAGI